MIDPQQLANLRAKAEAATHKQATAWVSKLYSKEVIEHIAAANPATVIAMIDEIERLRERNAKLERVLVEAQFIRRAYELDLDRDNIQEAEDFCAALDAAKETTDG